MSRKQRSKNKRSNALVERTSRKESKSSRDETVTRQRQKDGWRMEAVVARRRTKQHFLHNTYCRTMRSQQKPKPFLSIPLDWIQSPALGVVCLHHPFIRTFSRSPYAAALGGAAQANKRKAQFVIARIRFNFSLPLTPH